ncbi:MAG: hypothetical protein KBT07_01635 [Clostridiales bacterium]|nr:hypothetical protein [Candidatus Scatonaster coprocaballi]
MNEQKNPSYGGDQDWFTALGVEQDSKNSLIDENGCGVIALTDLVLYDMVRNRDVSFADYYELTRYTADLMMFSFFTLGTLFTAICLRINLMSLVEKGELVWASAQFVDRDSAAFALTSITEMMSDSEYGLRSVSLARGHYFNITGLVYDKIADEVYLRVSNGGIEEYILFSEYIDLIENRSHSWDVLGWANLIICY